MCVQGGVVRARKPPVCPAICPRRETFLLFLESTIGAPWAGVTGIRVDCSPAPFPSCCDLSGNS